MNIRRLILDTLNIKGEVKSSEIVRRTGFSRAYINRFFQELRDEGKIVLIGRANKARYISASQKAVTQARGEIMHLSRVLTCTDITEDEVLAKIKKETGIFLNMPENISSILSYTFLEMLNNAIEHSGSKLIKVDIERDHNAVIFKVVDEGMGIFNNIIQKKHLHNEMEAIQDLLKGKQTTAPEAHSGEGIFFSSKVVDMLIIQSSKKKLIFNNLMEEVFIKDVRNTVGTKVVCSIGLDSNRELDAVFREYTEDSFEFNKTKVSVKLFKMGSEYISRSQARRILSGLDSFKKIILDFRNVESVGQGFADETFRVWKLHHPDIDIVYQNANENVRFMIERALSKIA